MVDEDFNNTETKFR